MTPKQEAFAKAYVETSNASDAYRRSYDCSNMTDKSIHENACKLLKHAKVAPRIEELRRRVQERAMKRFDINIDTLTEMLREDRELARQVESPAAAVSAVMGIAKLHGFVVDKVKADVRREVTDLSDHELAAIAAGRGEGTAPEASIETLSDQLH